MILCLSEADKIKVVCCKLTVSGEFLGNKTRLSMPHRSIISEVFLKNIQCLCAQPRSLRYTSLMAFKAIQLPFALLSANR